VERSFSTSASYGVEVTASNACKNYNQISGKKLLELSAEDFTVNPMPVLNNASILVKGEYIGNVSLLVRDQAGQLCLKQNYTKDLMLQEYILNMESLLPGFYIMEIIFDDNTRMYKKLIKE
jgi:hypothetical protein